jgi:hypothetical protein
MKRTVLLALLGILALGWGASVAIHVATRPAVERVVFAPPPPPGELVPPPVPAPVPPSTPPSSQPQPVVAAPAIAAPVRTAPVQAPEYQERLESSDPDDRSEAMLEMRRQRKASAMDWLNRRPRR